MSFTLRKLLAAALGTLTLAAGSVASAADRQVIAATPVPHAEILEFVKPALAKEGVDLDIKVFTDFIQPNLQLAEKNIDANYYQYRPFLDEFNATRHTDLVPVVGVHVEPFGAYSTKIKNLFPRRADLREMAAPVLRGIWMGLKPLAGR